MTDERSFLAALHADPHNDLLRQVYADWLDDHDRPGADFLRLECAVYAEDARKNKRRTKRKGWELPPEFLEAARGLDSAWLAEVSRVPVEICGNLAFQFVCQKKWEQLTVIEDQPTTRHCESCQKEVHFCNSKEQAMSHATLGHCVALSLPIVELRGQLPNTFPRPIRMGVVLHVPEHDEQALYAAEEEQRRQAAEEYRRFS